MSVSVGNYTISIECTLLSAFILNNGGLLCPRRLLLNNTCKLNNPLNIIVIIALQIFLSQNLY